MFRYADPAVSVTAGKCKASVARFLIDMSPDKEGSTFTFLIKDRCDVLHEME
jgi:hypothetical protein